MAVKVTSNVRHDGVQYKAGDVIGDNDINEKQEQQLIDAGVANRTRGGTQGGEKLDREPSKVKQRVGAKPGERKTVAQKAQTRNAARTAAGKAVPQAKASDVDGNVPPASDELDTPSDNKQPEPNVGPTSGEGTQTQPVEPKAPEGTPEGFKIGDDEYTATATKNGQVQYRKNGTMIAKADFLEAQPSADGAK